MSLIGSSGALSIERPLASLEVSSAGLGASDLDSRTSSALEHSFDRSSSAVPTSATGSTVAWAV